MAPGLPGQAELSDSVWWSRERGGTGGGVAINHVYPINAQPLVGGQNWFDNVCRVRRVADAQVGKETNTGHVSHSNS